jgi:hypothetical protein
MDRPHGRLSSGYVQEVLRLENPAPHNYADAKVSIQPPAAPVTGHGQLSSTYLQAVAEFLANG